MRAHHFILGDQAESVVHVIIMLMEFRVQITPELANRGVDAGGMGGRHRAWRRGWNQGSSRC